MRLSKNEAEARRAAEIRTRTKSSQKTRAAITLRPALSANAEEAVFLTILQNRA